MNEWELCKQVVADYAFGASPQPANYTPRVRIDKDRLLWRLEKKREGGDKIQRVVLGSRSVGIPIPPFPHYLDTKVTDQKKKRKKRRRGKER